MLGGVVTSWEIVRIVTAIWRNDATRLIASAGIDAGRIIHITVLWQPRQLISSILPWVEVHWHAAEELFGACKYNRISILD